MCLIFSLETVKNAGLHFLADDLITPMVSGHPMLQYKVSEPPHSLAPEMLYYLQLFVDIYKYEI